MLYITGCQFRTLLQSQLKALPSIKADILLQVMYLQP